jgi:hypothetical protein
MTIPLDRLYHYIENLCHEIWPKSVIIYRFFPHGSKDFANLTYLRDDYQRIELMTSPYVFCHDQELLNYAVYNSTTNHTQPEVEFVQRVGSIKHNLRDYPIDIWDWALLTHSEKNSKELTQYEQDGFVGVYYWSHAIIARDWFRYAEHVIQRKQKQKTFLIYNRAWAGTREYRLKFAEYLARLKLDQDCIMRINPVDSTLGKHYNLHTFKNPVWRPATLIEKFFPLCSATSQYSADFNLADYESTDIEVVLETLFDDSRLHLTEKSLRPIALGQPFILAGTPGSLEYLRSYGFRTFGHVWDEQYDQETDPEYRLVKITNLMRQIANWTPEQRASKMAEAQVIADYNKQRFFSIEFFNRVQKELRDNLTKAFDKLAAENTSAEWLKLSSRIRATELNADINSPLVDLDVNEWAVATEMAEKYHAQNTLLK